MSLIILIFNYYPVYNLDIIIGKFDKSIVHYHIEI